MIALICQECGSDIELRFPSQAKTRRGGRRRFCSDQCARDHRGKLYVRACADRGLLTAGQVAELLDVSEHRVGDFRQDGALPATPIGVPGMIRRCYGYALADVQRFQAERIAGKPGPRSAEPVLAEAGEIGAQLAAAYCHVSYGVLMAARRAGKVKATEHRVAGIFRPVYGFKQGDLDAYKRAEAARTDAWHRRNLDPTFAAKMSRARGGDGITVAALAQARAADLGKRRGGRRADGHAERWTAKLQELLEQDGFSPVPEEEGPASLRSLCETVALDDYLDHPEAWNYDPEQHLRRAGERVRAAIRALQNRGKESTVLRILS